MPNLPLQTTNQVLRGLTVAPAASFDCSPLFRASLFLSREVLWINSSSDIEPMLRLILFVGFFSVLDAVDVLASLIFLSFELPLELSANALLMG